jgi:hypothetical protein
MPVDVARLTARIQKLAEGGTADHELSDLQVKAAKEVFGPGLITRRGEDPGWPET